MRLFNKNNLMILSLFFLFVLISTFCIVRVGAGENEKYFKDNIGNITLHLRWEESEKNIYQIGSKMYTFLSKPDKKFITVFYEYINKSKVPNLTPELDKEKIAIYTNKKNIYRNWEPKDRNNYFTRTATQKERGSFIGKNIINDELFPGEVKIGAIPFEISKGEKVIAVKFLGDFYYTEENEKIKEFKDFVQNEEEAIQEESETALLDVEESETEVQVDKEEDKPKQKEKSETEVKDTSADEAEQKKEEPAPPPSTGDLISQMETPAYPKDESVQGETGSVLISVQIDTGGNLINEPEIIESSGINSMDQAAAFIIREEWSFYSYDRSYELEIKVSYMDPVKEKIEVKPVNVHFN